MIIHLQTSTKSKTVYLKKNFLFKSIFKETDYETVSQESKRAKISQVVVVQAFSHRTWEAEAAGFM